MPGTRYAPQTTPTLNTVFFLHSLLNLTCFCHVLLQTFMTDGHFAEKRLNLTDRETYSFEGTLNFCCNKSCMPSVPYRG